MRKNLLVKIFLTVAFIVGIIPAFAVEPSTTHSVSGAILSQGDPVGLTGILQQAGKSQIIAAVLAWFLGIYGVHLFYLGYKKKGMNRLLLGIAGFAAFIIGFILGLAGIPVLTLLFNIAGGIILLIAWILTLIDFIKILTGELKPANGDYTETL